MEAVGIKFVCELRNGEINTWHDVFEKPVEDIIRDVKNQKDWIGGKFIEIYIEFNNNGNYYKISLDIENNIYNSLLGS